MPDPDLPVVEKRRVLRRFGWQREAGVFLDDLPMVAVPQLVAKHMAMNAVKLLAALHYRHTGTCLNGAYGVVTAWSQQGLPGRHEARDTLIGGMPDLGVGSRVNTSIGDQFGYRWGRNEQASIFGYYAEFGTGLLLIAAAAPWDAAAETDGWTLYEPPRSPR